MKVNQLVLWVMGALLAVILTLLSLVLANNNSRLDRIEDKADVIQAKYGDIAAIKGIVDQHTRQLDTIQERLFELLKASK